MEAETAYGGVYAGFTAKELREGKVAFTAAEVGTRDHCKRAR